MLSRTWPSSPATSTPPATTSCGIATREPHDLTMRKELADEPGGGGRHPAAQDVEPVHRTPDPDRVRVRLARPALALQARPDPVGDVPGPRLEPLVHPVPP